MKHRPAPSHRSPARPGGRAEPSAARHAKHSTGLASARRFRPGEIVREADLARARERRKRLAIRAALVTLLVVVAGVAARMYVAAHTGCGSSEARREALAALLEHRAAGDGAATLGERAAGARFVCAELGAPAGMLVAMREEGGVEPAIWYVDQRRIPYNVNLLALSWMPDLPAAPEIAASALGAVRRAATR